MKKQKAKKTRIGISNYPIGDFFIRVKNAAMIDKREVVLPSTKHIKAAAAALKKSGFLEDFLEKDKTLTVHPAFRHKEPVLMGLRIVSRPGLRIYMGVRDIEKKRGPSIFLLSTPQGIISSKDALKLRSAGEVLVEVW